MLINEVCTKCDLTKKAVEYYEKHGLIRPQVEENGYRSYSEQDCSLLKEVSILRKLGLGVPDIGRIIAGKSRLEALSACKHRLNLKLRQLQIQSNALEQLIVSYDIDQAAHYIKNHVEEQFTIQEKLRQAFPGGYGLYLSVHFGRFLKHRITSAAMAEAYIQIMAFLDQVSLQFPPDLEEYLSSTFDTLGKKHLTKINNDIFEAVEDIDAYLEKNKDQLEKYIALRNSEEFKETPAYVLQQALLAFNQTSGYYEIFIPNLKILSPAYTKYTAKLEQANTKFLEIIPQAEGKD